ncbi:MAG: aminoacyl-tRNA hydrolase [Deltaproteobacteria bacterium]|nr:aminoacyl-tRNA hydrolase [Deltaproteobacteria bacterium]
MAEDLIIIERLTLPGASLRVQLARSGGPGGQHVNTTDTKVQLFFDLEGCTVLSEAVRARVRAARPGDLTKEGELLLSSGRSRSQHANLEEVRERLAELIRRCLTPPKVRRPTRPSRSSQRRRVEGKKQRGQLKQGRGRVKGGDA